MKDATRFEWDPEKDRANRTKHGVSFEEAKELFESGLDYLEIYDENHSSDEDRFIAIGPIRRGTVVVAFAEQENVIRVVSARMASTAEIRRFDAYWRGRK